MKTASFSLASRAMGLGSLMKARIARANDLAPSTAPEVSKHLLAAEQALELAQEQLLNALNALREHDKKPAKVES